MKTNKIFDGVNSAGVDEDKIFDFYCPEMPSSKKFNYWKVNCKIRQRTSDSPCRGGCAYIKISEGRQAAVVKPHKTLKYGIRPVWFYQELDKLMLDKTLTLDQVSKKLGVSRTTARSQHKKLKRDRSLGETK
jgi:hypothetical protein